MSTPVATADVDERALLRASVQRFLAERYPFERRQATLHSPLGRDAALWSGLADELGVLQAGLATDGAADGSFELVAVVLEELGAALAAEPFLGTVMTGGQWLGRAATPLAAHLATAVAAGHALLVQAGGPGPLVDGPRELLATRTASGYRVDGTVPLVIGAPWATHLIVVAGVSTEPDAGAALAAVIPAAAGGVEIRALATIDGHRAGTIVLRDVAIAPEAILAEGAAVAVLESAVHDTATLAICCEALGVLRRLTGDTVTYARQRRQFGRAIADNQAIRHRIADMYVALEQSAAIVDSAAARLADEAAARGRAVSVAKWQVSRACRRVGEGAIQIHGAIGTTDELPLGHYFKRALVIAQLFGTAEDHLLRYDRLLTA